ncbi:MAG: hypothetical protein K8S99_10930 [Planctomycetes bacterium]|nr:hypothetical protein [Planctomycetota bacterium]
MNFIDFRSRGLFGPTPLWIIVFNWIWGFPVLLTGLHHSGIAWIANSIFYGLLADLVLNKRVPESVLDREVLCDRCGYDLRGHLDRESIVCPECGLSRTKTTAR